ncbi:MAG: endo-1,4-beta-xylanase [Muribaculaceae bacterium]|nr:endo-1,4-beta-xylanase [Muribaculaceae bacterium]
MKLLNILAIGAMGAAIVSCSDDFDTNGYKVDQPQESAQYEYLKDYGPLKSYVNRSGAGAKFRLGGAVDAAEFNERGLVHALAVANYDEITFGNHMKHNYVMADDGTMDFGTILSAIENARAAGISIFGHTLAWHSQQQGKYLLSLLQDREIEVDPNEKNVITDYELNWGEQDGYSMWGQWGKGATTTINKADNCLEVMNPEAAANFWDLQFFIADGINLVNGRDYELTITARTLGGECEVRGNIGTWNQGESCPVGYKITDEWKDYVFNFTPTFEGGSHILTQFGDFVGTVQFKSIKLTHSEAPESEITVWYDDNCLQVITDDKVNEAWDSQFWLVFPGASFNGGDKWEISMDVRANESASIGTQVHKAPGEYLHWKALDNIPFTPTWTNFSASGTFDDAAAGGYSIALNLNDYAPGNEYYFDNISFKVNGVELITNATCDPNGPMDNYVSKECRGDLVPTRVVDGCYTVIKSNMQPLTPEEKEEIVRGELKRWIYGMMEACNGYVTAWDVVNEAIGDGGLGDGVKHGDDKDDEFYWQNYLGDNYARDAVKFAREAFAEYGGNPDELLLFVNDYNLEAEYNKTAKTDNLIRVIGEWEADGVTRIDGIGTQMHVTYSMNPEYQAKQEQCVIDMFTKLAASGKLVHVSELDMGITDENGNTIMTADLTFEQKQLMSDYYKFIVKKFFEIIPKEQQYGVVQWAARDAGSQEWDWRKDQPIGIWDRDYARKPAYAGWCEGLQEGTAN